MAKRIIIERNALTIYDTVEDRYIFAEPSKDVWYSEATLQRGVIRLENINPRDVKKIDQIALGDSLDKQGAPYTIESFREFAIRYLAKTNGGGSGQGVAVILNNEFTQIINHGLGVEEVQLISRNNDGELQSLSYKILDEDNIMISSNYPLSGTLTIF